MNKLTEDLIAQVTDAEGKVDYATLKEVWKDLTAYRHDNKEEAAKAEQAVKTAAKVELATLGKAYLDTLNVGDKIAYTKADGTVLEGTLGEQKAGAKRAHIVLNEVPAGSKGADRYIAYEQINVPEDFVVEATAAA